MAVQILSARPEHSDGIGYVHYTAWEQTYRGLMPDGFLNGRTLEKCRALSRAYPGPRLVAVDSRQVVGFACYEREARDFTNRVGMSEVSALYLLRSHQGQGNGRRSMEACLAALPHAQVILYVLKGNGQAIGFYGHMGFCLTGRELEAGYRLWRDCGAGNAADKGIKTPRISGAFNLSKRSSH
ncbi:MAG: GNAT family N-acetyltransferase [Clostridiales bacterium]|nr:GNAT family N-acetyltransferase [Clostridiales bacterium]